MATFEEAVEAQRRSNDKKEDKIQWQLGYLGDTAGNVDTSTSNKILVRYPYENSPAQPVLDLIGVARVANVRVIVGYLPWMPGVFQIIAASDHRLDVSSSSSDTTISPVSSGVGYNPNVGLHAINHQYLGVDPIYINWRQIVPLGVFPTNPPSLSVQIFGGYLPHTGADTYVPNQIIDLTTSIPGSGARYSLISFNLTTGAVTVTNGTINVGGFSSLTFADIPDTPAGCWRSCAVALYFGQTAIIETNSERDFFDVRYPEEFPAGNVSPSSILLTHNHILIGNASNNAADVAQSGDFSFSDTGVGAIVNSAVTYAKMQNVSATQRALGRNTAGAGVVEEVTATQLIDWLGSTRGAILYRGASGWAILTPGASGDVLMSNGAGADPSYTPLIPGAVNVYNETASGDGSTTTFYLANVAVPSTIRVYIDGVRQAASDDTDPTDTVIFSSAPFNGASLIFDYELFIA